MAPQPGGRVLTEAKIENLKDLWAVEQGLRTADQARSMTVTDALVDTGATLLSLPTALINRLGLSKVSSKQVRSSMGVSEASLYEAVRLKIGGRSCTNGPRLPAIIGLLPELSWKLWSSSDLDPAAVPALLQESILTFLWSLDHDERTSRPLSG